ncbi:hypothetical protein GCM10022206_35020 [Streptomyces chiangmaiensis]
MSAELFHVIASIIGRHVRTGRPIPLVSRYDPHDKVWSPPMPFLFQRQNGAVPAVFNPGTIQQMIQRRCLALAEVHPGFKGLKFTPHDFRRIFITELVNSGLPIHIGAALLGHLNIQTTRGYVAVFDEDVIRHYQEYLQHRRQVRPEGEYRDSTPDEWSEFEEHFDRRKVELGACGRPYGTPCQHEHAPLTERTLGISQFRGKAVSVVATVTGRDERCARARSGRLGGSSVGSAGGDRRPVRALSASRCRWCDRGAGRGLLPGTAGGRQGSVDGSLLRDGSAPVVAVPSGRGCLLGPSEPGHDLPQFAACGRRQRIKNGLQVVPTTQHIVARATRQRHIEPPTRLAQEPLVLAERLTQEPGPKPVSLKAPDSSLGTSSQASDLAELSGLTPNQPRLGAHGAGRLTRHRPFGSTSWRHPATPRTDRPSNFLQNGRPTR